MRTIKVWFYLFLAVIASDAGSAEENAAKDAEKNALSGRIQERSNKSNKQVVKGGKANKNLNKAKAVDNEKIAPSKKPVKTKPVKLVKVQTTKTSLQKKTTIIRASSRNVKSPVITTTEKVIFSVLEKATLEGFKVPNFMIEESGNGKSQKTTQTIVSKAVSSSSAKSSATSTPASSTPTKSSTTLAKRAESLLGVSFSTPDPATSKKGTVMLTKKLENPPAVISSTTTKPPAFSSSTSEGPLLLKGSKPLFSLDDPQSKVTANQLSSSPTIAPSTSTTTTTTTTKPPKTVKAAASLLLPSLMARGVIPDPSGLTQDEYSQFYNMETPTLLRGTGINPFTHASSTSESTSRLRGSGTADQASSLAANQAPNLETTPPQVEPLLLRGSKPLFNDPQTSEGAMLVTATTVTNPNNVKANNASRSLPPPYMMLRGVVPVAIAKSPSNVTVTNNQTNPASSNNTVDQKYGEANSSNSNNVQSNSTSTTTSTLTTTTPKIIKSAVNLLLPPPNMMLRGMLPVALAMPKLTANVSTASNQTNSVVNVPASNSTDAANFSSLVDNVVNASSTAATRPPTATFENLI